MARWIAFDRDTARSMSYRMDVPVFCVTDAEPLEWALESNAGLSYLVLPSKGSVALAKLQWQVAERPQSDRLEATQADASDEKITREPYSSAGGFLGVEDETEYNGRRRRVASWWRKL